MALSADATQLASLLGVLTQPDTEAIRQAEQALKPLLKDPRCVPALVEILKAKTSQVSPFDVLEEGVIPFCRETGTYIQSPVVVLFTMGLTLIFLFVKSFDERRLLSVMLLAFCFESAFLDTIPSSMSTQRRRSRGRFCLYCRRSLSVLSEMV